MKHIYTGRRILLVEDEPINREIVLSLLDGSGLSVDIAEDGLAAIAQVVFNVYDLILMDVQMPGMGGVEATRRIRALPNGARPPILAMTAHTLGENQASCLEAGMDDFLTKPTDPDVLFQRLSKWLSVDGKTLEAGRTARPETGLGREAR